MSDRPKDYAMVTTISTVKTIYMVPMSVISEECNNQGFEITEDIANLSIDPNSPYSSFIRGVNELQRRGFDYKYINEFQEVLTLDGN